MCVVVTLHHFHSGKRGPFLNDVMPIRSFTVKALMKDPLRTLTIRIPATKKLVAISKPGALRGRESVTLLVIVFLPIACGLSSMRRFPAACENCNFF